MTLNYGPDPRWLLLGYVCMAVGVAAWGWFADRFRG